jgi:transposase
MARVEIFHERSRRRWAEADKRRLVAETLAPGATVHGVARRHGVNTSQLFTWRKRLRVGIAPGTEPAVAGFAAVTIAPSCAAPSMETVEPMSSSLIEIELVGGDRVRISGAPDPAVVAAALRALAGR